MVQEGDYQVQIPLLSISRPAWEVLERLPIESRVVGVFQHAVDIQVGEEMLALITPPYKNGVFHLVVPWLPSFSSLGVDIHSSFFIRQEDSRIRIGSWLIEIPSVLPIWEPTPKWEDLRAVVLSNGIEKQLTFLFSWLWQQPQPSPSRYSRVIFDTAVEELDCLKEGLCKGDDDLIKAALLKIIGRGEGLTPAGDDFLAGVMLGSYLFGQSVDFSRRFCEIILNLSIGRTTKLSLAFLKAAAQGYADERWQNFLEALTQSNLIKLKAACKDVIAYGASSGWDMLNGFLWMWDVTYGSKRVDCNTFQNFKVLQLEGVRL